MTTTSHTLGQGDDAIAYDVRGDLADATPDRPPLFLFGSPMDATGFGTLASYFTDRPVLTYDPRGSGRNPAGTTAMTPEQHAEDLHRIVEALGAGSVDAFGSSGGAVNLLALAAAHPGDLRIAVVHEPPTAVGLPDGALVLAACRGLKQTYEAHGEGPAMADFIALVMHQGELPADYLDRPRRDPAQFGLPTEDDGVRTNPLFRNIPACNEYAVDPAVLEALGDRLVVAVGVGTGEAMPARGGRTVAAALSRPSTEFPGDHGGFMGGEYGQHGEPEAFAGRLREVLDRR